MDPHAPRPASDAGDPDRDEEAALFHAARRGDRVAMGRLWNRHRRWVAAVLFLHAGRAGDVDDLLQEVATAFVTHIASVRDPASLPAWLRQTALNAARMDARGGSRRRGRLQRFAAALRGRPEPAPPRVETEEAAALLRERLAHLPEEYAEPLLLRLVHDLPYARIAAILDLPETTVENRIVRGRRLLRTLASDALAVPAPREARP